MVHRGDIVQKVLIRKNVNKTALAAKMGMSRNNLYKQLERDDMSVNHILHIGRLINVDFSQLIPGLDSDLSYPSMVNEPLEPYRTKKEIEITIRLDGSDESLSKEIRNLKALNETLRKLSQDENA